MAEQIKNNISVKILWWNARQKIRRETKKQKKQSPYIIYIKKSHSIISLQYIDYKIITSIYNKILFILFTN